MPLRFRFALIVTEAGVHPPVTRYGASFLVGAEVPIQDQGLTLRVTSDPFTVPSELGIVRGQQLQAGHRPLPELVDDAPVPEDALHLPVGGEGTEIDDPHVPLGRLGLLQFFG